MDTKQADYMYIAIVHYSIHTYNKLKAANRKSQMVLFLVAGHIITAHNNF